MLRIGLLFHRSGSKELYQELLQLYDAALSEWEQMSWTEAWLQHHNQSLEYEHQIEVAQARLLTLSSNTKQIFVSNNSLDEQDFPDRAFARARAVQRF